MNESNFNDGRPLDLTPNFIPILVQNESTRLGLFQIVEFYQKRQHLYSTKISDGFFRIKVMFAYSAGKMISQGKIKLFSIINGEVQNHGSGVFIVKNIVSCWDYHSVVGYFKDWKKSTPNVNLFGSNLIKWQHNEEHNYHPTATFGTTVTQSRNQISVTQSKQSKAFTTSPKQSEKDKKFLGNYIKKQQIVPVSPPKEKRKLLLSSQQSQQSQTCKNHYSHHPENTVLKENIIEDNAESQQQQFFDKIICQLQHKGQQEQQKSKPSSLQSLKRFEKCTQSQELFAKIKKVDEQVRRNSQLIKDRIKITDDLFQEFIDDLPQQSKATIKKVSSSRIKNLDGQSSEEQQYNLKWVTTQIERLTQNPSVSLKSQYQINTKQQTKEKNQGKCNSPQQNKQDDEDFQDFQWVMQFRQNAIIRSPHTNKQAHSSNIKQRLSHQKIKEQGIFKSNQQILFNQLHPKINKFWWVRVKVLGKSQLQRNILNRVELCYFITILKDKNDTLIEAKFIDIDYNQIQLERFYKIGGGFIKRTHFNKYKGCDLQLQFKNSTQTKNQQTTFKIQERGAVFADNPQNFNYCSFSKIDNLSEDTLINIIGLIKQVTTSKTKTGKYMIIYEIVDPIENTATNLTQFLEKSPNVQNQAILGCFISVYNAKVNIFRGKHSLMMKPNTIINIGSCQPTPHAIQIKNWLASSKDVQKFEAQLNYKECFNIKQALEDIYLQQFKLTNIKILAFATKYQYLACVSCFKKVDISKPICRQCGPRKENQSIMRKFIRGTAGDWSGICQIVWGDVQASRMLINGYQSMLNQWNLVCVDLWISRGKNNTLNVKKIKKCGTVSKNKKMLLFLKERVFLRN